MKICMNCGHEIEDDAKFCIYCGQAQGPDARPAESSGYSGGQQENGAQNDNAQYYYGPQYGDAQQNGGAQYNGGQQESGPQSSGSQYYYNGPQYGNAGQNGSAYYSGPQGYGDSQYYPPNGPTEVYQPYAVKNPLKHRSIVLSIIFCFISFGIYELYWMYQIAKSWNYVSYTQGQKEGTSPGLVLLFSIITFGIYSIYFWYKVSKQLSRVIDRNGSPMEDHAIACLILSIFGLGFVCCALHQNSVNYYLQYGM
ncbi:MAG: DUF4234 domain-containing protein [Anaerovoracaceae bacterium]|jgi:hypothetical protein